MHQISIKYCVLATLILSLSSSCELRKVSDQNSQDISRRPNIVIILADDLTGSDIGAYGNTDVYTPNLDRLAKEGIRFKNAFTGTAMCSPSRQQLLTGLFPVRNGAFLNGSTVKDGTPSMATLFKEAGYRVGLNGKTHFGPSESFPFQFLDVRDRRQKYAPRELNFTETREFLSSDSSKPFLLIVASENPHWPWTGGDQSAFDPDKIHVPDYLVDTAETRLALAKYYSEVTLLDIEAGRILTILEETGHREDTIVIFTSEHGAMFPHAKWTLYDPGVRTALMIRWPGMVEEGSVSSAMVHYVDILPTLLNVIEKHHSEMDGRSFLHVLTDGQSHHRDFVYGIHTTKGIKNAVANYPIRSIRSERYKLILNLNPTSVFRNNVVAENRGGYYDSWKLKDSPNAQRKFNHYQVRPAVELYDMVADAAEQHNLAGTEALHAMQHDLTQRLQQWMSSQKDSGLELERLADRSLHKVRLIPDFKEPPSQVELNEKDD